MNANSNANKRENGEDRDEQEREARAHLEAIAQTDLPYAEYAERALRAVEEGGDRDE